MGLNVKTSTRADEEAALELALSKARNFAERRALYEAEIKRLRDQLKSAQNA